MAFWQNYGFYIWLLTALALLVLAGAFVLLWSRLKRAVATYHMLTRGVEAAPLNEMLEQRVAQIQRVDETLQDLQRRLVTVEQGALQRIGLVRYNPFADVGGDQSFALALLDGAGNGVVVSTIFNRSGTRVYAKPVSDGQSTHQLSEEEIEAITRSREAQPAPLHHPA